MALIPVKPYLWKHSDSWIWPRDRSCWLLIYSGQVQFHSVMAAAVPMVRQSKPPSAHLSARSTAALAPSWWNLSCCPAHRISLVFIHFWSPLCQPLVSTDPNTSLVEGNALENYLLKAVWSSVASNWEYRLIQRPVYAQPPNLKKKKMSFEPSTEKSWKKWRHVDAKNTYKNVDFSLFIRLAWPRISFLPHISIFSYSLSDLTWAPILKHHL